ncbi:hypothetical protein [Streptomyces pinistramenti]|uniref:hypothetical protein n=1 Tax=Streptomyces pinistramenti TaxID=2884812 RepID=UPI001D067C09|nr:hypothetical protein [Streptomyces pinistramenti]MCB5911482.1 hypothetical protein [Streptomyces pinistramenti]
MGAGHGIASDDADRYLRSLFQGVGRALSDETRSLRRLAADHETPNGNNERIRTTWFDPANSEALNKALDDLLTDLEQPRVKGSRRPREVTASPRVHPSESGQPALGFRLNSLHFPLT